MIIRDFAVSPYAITFTAALAISFSIVYRLLLKCGISHKMIGYSIFLNLFFILYGAKMYTVFESGFRKNIFESGISSLGGVMGLLVGIYIFGCIYKEGRDMFLEAYAVVIPLMYGIAKLGCYLVGCCHGIKYHGIGAIYYENKVIQGGPYFPVQLLESIVFIGIFLVAMLFHRRNFTNTVSCTMVLCAIAKFALEYLREGHGGVVLSVSQMICIGFMAWAIVMFLVKNRRKS